MLYIFQFFLYTLVLPGTQRLPLTPFPETSAPDRVHEHPLAEGFLYGLLCSTALIVGLKKCRCQTCYDTLLILTQAFPSLEVRPGYHHCSWVPGILCGETQQGRVRQDQVRSCLLPKRACCVDGIHQHRNSFRSQVVPIHEKPWTASFSWFVFFVPVVSLWGTCLLFSATQWWNNCWAAWKMMVGHSC